jgi:hypothetical protein
MAALRHEYSWSISRSGLADTCLRAYYYKHYLAWGGWVAAAEPARRQAYRLSKLTRMPMWAGDCLHRSIAHWFGRRRDGERLTARELADHALAAFRAGYKQSRDETEAWLRRPKDVTRLGEHHYQEPCVDEPSGRAREYGTIYVQRLDSCARWFAESSELAPVREADPRDWLACEEFGTLELYKTRIHAVPDFAFRDAAGDVWIYDWKTGAEQPDHEFQLGLYALYAAQEWGADPSAVRCVAAYLEAGRVVEHRYDEVALERVLGRIHASITALRELHFDADSGSGDPARFPQVAPGSDACSKCGFREPCGR